MKAYTGFALALAADSVTGKQDRFLPCRCVFEGQDVGIGASLQTGVFSPGIFTRFQYLVGHVPVNGLIIIIFQIEHDIGIIARLQAVDLVVHFLCLEITDHYFLFCKRNTPAFFRGNQLCKGCH